MLKNKFKLFIFMLAIGFVLITLDVNVTTPFKYPHKYNNSGSVIGEFQYYNIASNYNAWCDYKVINTSSEKADENSHYNAINDNSSTNSSTNTGQSTAKVIDHVYFGNISVDIFSDALGFLFIFIACLNLAKVNNRFKYGSVTTLFALILHIVILALPFFLNGIVLCNTALVLGLAYLGSNIITTFMFSSGLLKMCTDICCRDERKWCKMTWYVTFVLQILVTFVFWIGSDFNMLLAVGRFFEGVLVFMVIVFWIILKRTYYYLERTWLNYEKQN